MREKWGRAAYQRTAFTPVNSDLRASGYDKKFSSTITLILGSRDEMLGRGRRERMRRDVMSGFESACARISLPTKPDVPVSIYFIVSL